MHIIYNGPYHVSRVHWCRQHTPLNNIHIDSVKEEVKGFGIKNPVIQDTSYGTWNTYENRYCPSDYLVDDEGFIRYDHIGEGGYSETGNMIQTLLVEPGTTKV